MKSKLIIIRGNSRSGKTTTAKRLQTYLGPGTLLVSQDIVRREMLKIKDRDGNLAIDLIRQIAEYGKDKCEYTIVEGILYTSIYGEMLNNLIRYFDRNAFAYYFDLSFEETVTRHNASAKKGEFGIESMRAWWNPDDCLKVEGETLLTSNMSQDDVLKMIAMQVQA